MIDLHVHTIASDGSMKPSTVVDLAAKAGLRALGITDHDSVEGVEEFMARCSRAGIEGVRGIEIGVEHGSGTMHLLGYFIDPHSEDLRTLLGRIREDRIIRAEKIVEKLNSMDIDLTIDKVREQAGDSPPGRPHVSIAMWKNGFVSSIEEAFDRFLRAGREAYVERRKPSFDEARDAIRRAGGVAVLAHPISLDLRGNELLEFLKDLAARGLSGLEVYHPTQSASFRETLKAIAEKLSIEITGGSDFHGAVRPDWKIGVGLGDLEIPYSCLDRLRKRSEERS